jgi:hypothetical protein
MQIINAQWTNATRTMVRAEINGALSFIPADPTGNAHFAHLLAMGEGVIADPEPAAPSDPEPDADAELAPEGEAVATASRKRTKTRAGEA